MPDNATAKRVWDIFARPTPPLRKQFKVNPQVPPLQGIEANAEPIQYFSDFNIDHIRRVHLISKEMQRLASSGNKDDTAFGKALDFFESLIGKENPDLLFYTLQFFLVHYNGKARFQVPSIMVREPEIISPSNVPARPIMEIAVGSNAETKLDWFRESPFLK